MMVRPAKFGFNAETATNNAFQENDKSLSSKEIQKQAVEEFDNMVAHLRFKGVNVHIISDTDSPIKPDAVFPNNWISFHQNGTVIQYPMYASNRRIERQSSIVHQVREHFSIDNMIDFTDYEKEDVFLEGTGSMILDRPNKIVYACVSPRTDIFLLDRFCKRMGYKKVAFGSKDQNGQDIYHTNVMMAIGETFAVICMDSITDPKENKVVRKKLEKSKKEIIDISFDQMNSFAGNMLQVRNNKGKTYLVMSQQAHNSLNKKQIKKIEKHTQIFYAPIPTIEKYGGGSTRCMMAEIFLPMKKK